MTASQPATISSQSQSLGVSTTDVPVQKENESEMSSVYDEPPRKTSTKAAAGTKPAQQAKQAKPKGDIKIGGRTSGRSKEKAEEDVAEVSSDNQSIRHTPIAERGWIGAEPCRRVDCVSLSLKRLVVAQRVGDVERV